MAQIGDFSDPHVAVSAAWQLAVNEGNVETAAILKRLKDVGGTEQQQTDGSHRPTAAEGEGAAGGADEVDEAMMEGTTTGAADEAPAAGAAPPPPPPPKDAAAPQAATTTTTTASRAQITQLQAQLGAFRRLSRGLAVPPALMAAAITNAEEDNNNNNNNNRGGPPSTTIEEAASHHPIGTSLSRRRQRQRLVDSKARARVNAIAALPPTLPDEVRRAAAIESKALKLLALQRKVRYEVAMEPRLTLACGAPGMLLDSRTTRRPTDPSTYVETITRAEALKLQSQQIQANAAEEKKQKARQHSQQLMATAKANQRRVEEARRADMKRRQAEAEATRRAQMALAMAKKREHDARVAVVAERRRWLAQLLQHGRDIKEGEKADRLRQKKRNDGVLAFHRKCQNGLRREERERIQALKAGDEEAYMRLVQDSKNQRIEELLHTTDDLLKHLADRIENMKAAAARATDHPDLLDDEDDEENDEDNDDGGGAAARGRARVCGDGAGHSGSGSGSGSDVGEKSSRKTQAAAGAADGGGGKDNDGGGDDGGGEDAVKSPERFSGIRQYGKLAHSADQEEILVQPSVLVGPNGAGEMRSYQLAGLQWMVSLHNNNLNGILADEMGLGKTIQCISLFAYLAEVKGNRGPHLVLAPKAVLPNWAREFKIWYPECEVVMYDGYKDARKVLREEQVNGAKFNVLLTHYDLVMYDKTWLSKIGWNYIVVDEGHRLKNHQSKLSTVLQAAYTAKHRLLLTGTPIQNNLTELWSLLNFLLPSVFNSSEGFEMWFNAPFSATKDDAQLKEEEELLIIQRLHQVIRPFLLRRKKKEVEKELPDKEEVTIKCAMSAWQRAYYCQVLRNGAVSTTEGKARQLQNTAMQLRKVCNHPYLFVQDDFYHPAERDEILRASGKFELLDRILPKLHKSGHRVLLFSQMVKCLDLISDYLEWKGYDYLRLDGSTNTESRGELLEKFNAPDSPHFLFMLSTRAGGMGLNLQTADTVIIFDSDWNPQMDAQAEDRAHRIGQKRRVKVLVLVCDGTIEEDIQRRAGEKKAIDHKAIQAGMFNQASTAEERNAVLKDILQRGEDGVGADVPTQAEVNVMIARSEEEIEMFDEMDKEIEEGWVRTWGTER